MKVSELKTIHPRTRSTAGPIASGVHPAVRLLWQEILDRNLSTTDVGRVSGVSMRTIKKWKRGETTPDFVNLEAVLNTLGYDLKIVKKEDAAA